MSKSTIILLLSITSVLLLLVVHYQRTATPAPKGSNYLPAVNSGNGPASTQRFLF